MNRISLVWPLRSPTLVGVFCLGLACADDASPEDEATGSTDDDDGSSGPSTSSSGASGTSDDDEGSSSTHEDSGVDSTSGTDSSSGGSSTSPIANDDVFRTPSDEMLTIEAADGVLANDSDPQGDVLQVIDFDGRSQRGGTVDVDTFGGFTYTPPVGAWGPDAFDYTVADEETMATATVTINITPMVVSLDHPAMGEGGFVIDGAYGDQIGHALAGAGDVNGDGLEDIAVGVPYEDDYAGRVDIVFGKADLEAVAISEVGAGSGGFRLEGNPVPGDGYTQLVGTLVDAAGDVNGDGLADVIVGTETYTNDAVTLRAYVVFGKDDTEPVDLLDVIDGEGGFVLRATGGPGYGGTAFADVAGAGDVNGDGLDDIVVGIESHEATGNARTWVVFGKNDTDLVDLDELSDTGGGFVIEGETRLESYRARWTSGAGDVDGDGLADVVIGNSSASPNGLSGAGRCYVVHGKPDEDTVDLVDLAAGDGGFVIDGGAQYQTACATVRTAGDVDGDGHDDLVLSTLDQNTSYVVRGKADTDAVSLGDLSDGQGYRFMSPNASSLTSAIAGGRDLDGDGLDDVGIGAPSVDTADGSYGRTFVVYGRVETFDAIPAALAMGDGGFVLDSESNTNETPDALALADVNGDGLADLLLGNGNPTQSVPFAGRVYVVLGTSRAPYD
jgi:hypothetical protein